MAGRHRAAAPELGTAPVLAVLVCHDGAAWLPETLAALRAADPRPRHVLAVDTGSVDATPHLLSAAVAARAVDGVLTMPRDTGFGDAVRHAVARAETRWGDPGRWVWLLHDDSAPDDDCLDVLVTAAAAYPSAAVLGPLALDWDDPRLVVEAGLSTDASGHRQTGLGAAELDPTLLGGLAQNTEVLAVGSAGALIRRDVWHELDGYDRALPLLRDDLDFGWRANAAGHLVLVIPHARVRHAVAATRGLRPVDALAEDPGAGVTGAGAAATTGPGAGVTGAGAAATTGPGALGGVSVRAADRANGVRTFLVNTSAVSFVLGVPRLVALCVLRALAFALARRPALARAELHAARHVVSGGAGLRAARAARPRSSSARGLLTSRWSRLRNLARLGVVTLVRRRLAADVAIGRLPDAAAARVAPRVEAPRRAGPDVLPAGAQAGRRRFGSRVVVPAGPAAGAGLDVLRPAGAGPGAPDVVGSVGSVATARAAGAGVGSAARAAGVGAGGAAGVTGAVGVGVGSAAGVAAAVGEPTAGRPTPRPRDGSELPVTPAPPELVVVDVGAGRLARELLLAPVVLLVAGLSAAALLLHGGRLGLDLSGGRVAPALGLAQTWSAYVAEWHAVFGGTASPSPATLAVVGVLGAVPRLFGGGPGTAVSLLLLTSVPLAGVSAYTATRRMRVPRWGRATAAAAYALLPVGAAAAAQGRLDGVVAHVLLPAILAGVAGVLTGWSVGRAGGARAWLPSACATAIGLAVVSAFAPLVHVLVLVLVLVGFIAAPGPRGMGARRIVALFVIVLLPLGLLLPWPAVVVQHPSMLVHGTGTVVAESQPDVVKLLALDAGGAGWGGLAVVLACVLVVAVRPRRGAIAGVAVTVVGLAAAVVVSTLPVVPLAGGVERPGWPGAALLLAGLGMVLAALGAVASPDRSPTRAAAAARATARGSAADRPGDDADERDDARARWRAGAAARSRAARLAAPAAAAGAVTVFAIVVVVTAEPGAVTTERPRLAATVQNEVVTDGTAVLVIGADERDPVRAAVGRLPAFGDDDLAPVATAPARMARWAAALRSGESPAAARTAVLEAAVAGVEFVVLPDRAAADAVLDTAGELVAAAPDTSDGRPVVRLLPLPMPAAVLAPQLADRARTGGAPPADYGAAGVVPAPASPPVVGVSLTPGSAGRALVVAAETEDGWTATVNGEPVPVARAWGHLVAVALPPEAADVRVERSSTLRTLLLLAQLAVALFTLVTAIPPADRRRARERRQAPSTVSGSRPR